MPERCSSASAATAGSPIFHHNVNFTEEAVNACVKLTNRYITDRHLPDKAIDALDEAGSRVHISTTSRPPD